MKRLPSLLTLWGWTKGRKHLSSVDSACCCNTGVVCHSSVVIASMLMLLLPLPPFSNITTQYLQPFKMGWRSMYSPGVLGTFSIPSQNWWDIQAHRLCGYQFLSISSRQTVLFGWPSLCHVSQSSKSLSEIYSVISSFLLEKLTTLHTITVCLICIFTNMYIIEGAFPPLLSCTFSSN